MRDAFKFIKSAEVKCQSFWFSWKNFSCSCFFRNEFVKLVFAAPKGGVAGRLEDDEVKFTKRIRYLT